MKKKFDFSGWATKNDLKCSDGRVIRKNAFAHMDGLKVPLVYNHDHSGLDAVIGHCLLENRDEGVYAYGYFNETPEGQRAKLQVQHGDLTALSIYANQLKQQGCDVFHGAIREVSLVLAGANPGALIDNVSLAHCADFPNEEGIIYTDSPLDQIIHSGINDEDEDDSEEEISEKEIEENPEVEESEEIDSEEELEHSEEDSKMDKENKSTSEETVEDVFNTLTDKQKTAVYFMMGAVMEDEDKKESVKHSDEGGEYEMKQNVFDANLTNNNEGVLSHADEENIIALAKNGAGTLQRACEAYFEEHEELAHSFDSITSLYPEYKNITPGAPDMITTDQGWVSKVVAGVSKSPISRIKTRIVDAKNLENELRALGYKKGDPKVEMPNVKLITRSMDPQTIYVKDKLDRDDIIDITDFDVVEYEYKLMRLALNEEIATAIMIGDGRDEGDDYKIHESHIKPIWTDNELYTIHQTIDFAATKAELQGTDTGKHFGDNYIYAEAIITAALYAREKYKGSGNLDFYCTPHLLNVMLLARDLNGRRIYSSKADLAAALNVRDIVTAEQFEGKTRVDANSKTKKLLGLFVNLSDYKVGSTKGGEITKFDDFDIDFNQYKYLMETRISGGLTKILSAIALEEEVTVAAQG